MKKKASEPTRATAKKTEPALKIIRRLPLRVAINRIGEPTAAEHVVVLLLNTRHKLLGYHVAAVGSLNEAVVHPRDILRSAVLLAAAIFPREYEKRLDTLIPHY